MAWRTSQTFACYHKSELVDVASQNNQRTRVVTMPASDVRAGNTYAFILTGILGGFVPTNFSGDTVCEVALEAGGGAVYDNSRHRMDMAYNPLQSAFGQPFMTIVVVPSAAAVDYSMVFSCTRGRARIDAPTLQVWDMTECGASAALSSTATSPTSLATSPAQFLQGPTLNPQRKWLVYWSAEIEQKSWIVASNVVPPTAGLWLTKFASNNFDANTVRTYYSGAGQQLSHIGCGPRASTQARLDRRYTRIRMGDWAFLEDPVNTYQPSIWGESVLGIGSGVTHDVVHRADMLCIDLSAAAVNVEHQRVAESGTAFPGRLDDLIGYRDEPRTHVRGFDMPSPSPADATAVMGTVRCGSYVRGVRRNFRSHVNFTLDVDGGKQSPQGWVASRGSESFEQTLYVLMADAGECLPTHRFLAPALDKGPHCFRWYGRHHQLKDDTIEFWPNFYDATWLQFLGVKGYTVPAPIAESAGPEVAVSIRRESVADLSALPALPAGYSNRIDVDVVDPVVDHRSEGGYLHRLPRFAQPRELVSFEYRNLTPSQLASVLTFLRALSDSQGAFRATRPDRTTEAGYALDVEGGWRMSARGERGTVSFRAIELLYMVTP